MKLYSSQASPFVRKVVVCLYELDLYDQVEVIEVAGTPLNAGTMPVDVNPLGKIPTFETTDGKAIFDSRVITRYLNDHAKGALYSDGDLWDLLALEALIDGIMDAAVAMTYERRVRPADYVFEPMIDGQWAKVSRALDLVGVKHMLALDSDLTIVQISMGCMLEYLDFRHADREWRNGRDQLANWQSGFAKRKSMQATQPIG